MSDDMDPQQFYDEFGEHEWERLDQNPVARLEFENTTDYLAEILPNSDDASGSYRILDAGGGAGRYALWLADCGYDVTLADLSAEQVRIAREKADERGLADRVTCQQADLCDLPFEDEEFDAVCCLGGPLSHVVDPTDREEAVSELRRVVSPDSPVFVSVIGRLNTLRDIVKNVLDDSHGLLPHIAETGDYTQEAVEELAGGEGWAECHFFRADEFEAELEAGGLTVEQLVGLEGPASGMQAELAEADDDELADVREIVRELREDRSVVDMSEHMLAVCWA